MKQKRTRDLLIRNVPVEVVNLLEKNAIKNRRSKTQEAIVTLSAGLTFQGHRVKKPKPFRWNKKISNRYISKAIDEGREK